MDNSYRSSKDVQISKTLSYLLRHGAEKEGLQMTKGSKMFICINDWK
jgi:RNA:NAD 2'-phosphotransferase (TPT1/KptA family)